MASQKDLQRNFRLFVTHVEGEGAILKISGQLDKRTICQIEHLMESSRDSFDKGFGSVPPSAILDKGFICAAKYKDGAYYRAQVICTMYLASGLVGVHFIDYGDKGIVSLDTIRLLDNCDPLLLQLRGQARDYFLAKIMHPTSRWEEHLLKLQRVLCNFEYLATVEATTPTLPLISVQFQGNDLTDYLVSNKYGIGVPIIKQVLHVQLTNEVAPAMATNWQPNFYLEPANTYPAPVMRSQQNVSIPYNRGLVSNPMAISQRLLVNKVSRNPVSLRGRVCQPQLPLNTGSLATVSVQAQLPVTKEGSPKKTTFKCRTLKENTEHKVFVSYAEEGPETFAVQVEADAKKLQNMMDELNRQPHRSLTEPPMIGTMCLGRMSENRIICRAIVLNLSGSQCKLFFIDFGDTEIVSYYDILDIPEEFVEPEVFAMRFCLSGVKNLETGPHLNEAFKQLVNGKVLTLRVVPLEGPPLIQYGELYIDNKNVLDLLMQTVKETLKFQWLGILTRGSKHSVTVSYVDSCLQFFVQLSDKIDELNAVMDAVKAHCESTSSPGLLPVGAACCARFPDDGRWYRARLTSISGSKIKVAYVDYGNEEEVEESNLRTITTELIQLPAQAMKCALKGYEDKPVETKTSHQFEMLALEKTLIAHIMCVLSGDRMLVTLTDNTVSPPLDVARKMVQLSQTKSNHEPKATNPIRTDERRGPREENEVGQRGGSFRGRDNTFNKQDEREENKNDKWEINSRPSRDRPDRRNFGGDRRVHWADIIENSYQKIDSRENGSKRGDRSERSGDKPSRPVALETPFTEPSIDPKAQHEVSVTWIISPDSFYTQILSLQHKFLDMMHTIPEMYKGVKPFTGTIPVGASVLAKYPKDGVLYRATIISVQPFGKYKVQYIDYGNKFVVDTRDIWQLDQQLMELPKIAVHCSLSGVAPKDGKWKANSEIDLCFNAPRYQCVFQECVDDKHKVSLWNNGTSVADMLIEKELALAADLGSSVTLKDEAIDLTIIVGQQILCRVTHVESFEKFYVQLDLEKALLVESAIADYDTSLLTPLAAESLVDGVHCTLRHQDKIYRAILIDVSDSSNVTAALPDYGMSITTALDKLMILPTALSKWYYQALECCFNNYTAESKTLLSLEELKTRIMDKKLIAYINNVDGIRLVTTLYESGTGQKVAIFEPDDDACDEVVQLCTRAVFNYNFGLAYISHMENLNELYLQKAADGDRIALLLDEMYEFYNGGTPGPLTNYKAYAICAAHSNDGNWYRATILEATESECKVQFPDYGNTETIAKDALKKLDIKFYEPCALALVVGLGLVALQDDAIEKLKEFIEEKEVQVILGFDADGWLASLHLDGVDLSMKLVNEKLAAPQVANEEQAVESPVEEPVSLPTACTQIRIQASLKSTNAEIKILDELLSHVEKQDVGNVLNVGKTATASDISSEIVHDLVKGVEKETINEKSDSQQECCNTTEVVIENELPSQTNQASLKSTNAEIKRLMDELLSHVEKIELISVETVTSPEEIDSTKAETNELAPVEKLESIPGETIKSHAEIDLTKVQTDELTLVELESTPEEKVKSLVVTDFPKADGDDLDSSLTELNESRKSNDTVNENTSYEAHADTLVSGAANDDSKSESAQTHKKDLYASTLESSNDTFKTPERDDSKDSVNNDTGYTSGDHEKSPVEQSGKIITPPVSPEKNNNSNN